MKSRELHLDYQQTILAAHGAMIVLLGLLAGIGFSYAASTGEPDSASYGVWRFAHLEGIVNGLLVLGVAGIWRVIDVGRSGILLARTLLVVGCYANVLGPLITALFIGHRVIYPETLLESIVVYGFYIPGTLPLVALVIITANLFRHARRKYFLYRSAQ